jgi:aspartate/methionine/tyrosine aminotransferase
MMTTALGRALARRGQDWLATGAAVTTADSIDLSGEDVAGSTPTNLRTFTIDAIGKHQCDHYTRRPGIAPLCRAVADHMARFGVEINPDNGVVVTGGVRETRFVALRALAGNETVYLLRPRLRDYTVPISFTGASVQPIDLDEDLPAAQGGLLVLPNPNPATGQLYSTETLDRLADWATHSDLTVIADETAAPLLRPERPFNPFAARSGMADRTLTLGSFANISGLAAWQVGWFAGPKNLAQTVRDLKQAMTICSPAASQYAALAGVSEDDQHLVSQNIERVQALTAMLERLDISHLDPHTVAFVVVDVGELGGGDAVASTCAKHGVQVLSGSEFDRPNQVRITVGSYRFGETLSRLEAALTSLKEEA